VLLLLLILMFLMIAFVMIVRWASSTATSMFLSLQPT
jgi:hypothetical protein